METLAVVISIGLGLSWDEALALLAGGLSHFTPGEDLAHLVWYPFSKAT